MNKDEFFIYISFKYYKITLQSVNKKINNLNKGKQTCVDIYLTCKV